jgi:hypothetical protein
MITEKLIYQTIIGHIWLHILPWYAWEQPPNYIRYKLRNYFMASEAGVKCVEMSTAQPHTYTNQKKTVT